ncbi:MAG: tetratricopeptide repeat protein [Deltaproteobacteria bacterium]|nr:tetratricopeptide repeat protein [Deltaproteobacteria bacterium]
MSFDTRRAGIWLGVFFATSLYNASARAKPPDQVASVQEENSEESTPQPASQSAGEQALEVDRTKEAAGATQSDDSAKAKVRLPWESATELTGGAALEESAVGPPKDDRKPPSPQEIAALRELEAEVERFSKMGSAYQQSVNAILQRSYLWQRRELEKDFAAKIDEEEKLQQEARLKAIKLFEKFIAKYPDDPTYTPDAMFRLGELYYERTALAYQDEMDAYMRKRDELFDRGVSDETLVEPKKSYSDTVELYTRLVEKFPNYRSLDGVYYLIGYCLNEMGEPDKARIAWLNLVCANSFHYPADVQPEEEEPQALSEKEKAAEKYPALGLDEGKETPEETVYLNPYETCVPVVKESKFYAETWLRIGEYHFDYDFTAHGLDRSISAYSKVLDRPNDRNYNLALYKVAWAHYRASHFPEAIENFWRLVQWSDDEYKRTGKGSELRAEAIQYLGIAFAYDDWNENQVPDPQEGKPRGIDRLQDPKLMPQDRPWTAEVYQRVGYIYFDEAKYPAAVEVWNLALQRWPTDVHAPEIQNMIGRAYTRNNELEDAIAARAKLSDYGEGSTWWDANKDNPAEQSQAEKSARDALINTAINHHQSAQNLRRRCVEDQDLEQCREAQTAYSLAAKTYREYVTRYPNDPQAYELRYNLADALYWSENYEEAAREYAAVRDSNLDDKFLSISARLVVESIKRLTDQAAQAGQIEIRTEPPEPQGDPPRVAPIAMPPLLQRLALARDMYLKHVDKARDTENLRESYSYNNTLLLYLYGYWDLAKERLTLIYEERCKGALADETGRVAWLNLRNIAVSLNDSEEVRRLSTDLNQRQCTFTSGEIAAADVDCSDPKNKDLPKCLAGSDLTNLRYRDAVDIFAQAEKETGENQRLLYEKAATELVGAVNDEPNHAQAPLALEKAAIALERTSRFESAGRLYQRIIDEVGPRQAKDEEEQKSLDAILSNAYFRLAYNANRFFDFDRAVNNYRSLADSERFARSKDPNMVERREGALINAARILEYQQQYARAAEYYERAASILRDPNDVRLAHFRIAEMSYKQKKWGVMINQMREFILRYQRDAKAGEQLVLAYWRIVEARNALGQKREYQQALQDVVTTFSRTNQPAGSYAAEYAAQSKFILVDEGVAEFESFTIKPGKPATLNAYINTVTNQIEAGSVEAKKRAEGYSSIPNYRRPTWTIAAFVQQGRVYEVLARAVLNTPFVVPADLQKKMRGLPDYAKDDIKIQVEDAIRQVLDAKVRPIECLAVHRYALAARAARAGNVDNQYTRQAIDRINAYGDERIAECITQAAAQDASLTAYQSGEFTRAPRGQNLDVPAGVSPPSLAVGE